MNTPQRCIRMEDDLWALLKTIADKYTTDMIVLDRSELVRLFIEYCCKDEKLISNICRGII